MVTRRGTQHADCKPAKSLKSKLSTKSEKVDPLSASAIVKVEEEEANISGNVYVQRWITVYFASEFANLTSVEMATSFHRHVSKHSEFPTVWQQAEAAL